MAELDIKTVNLSLENWKMVLWILSGYMEEEGEGVYANHQVTQVSLSIARQIEVQK
jgi:hypothetical protein